MTLRICIAGVTGWTGSAVARAVLESPEFELVGGIARKASGLDVGRALGVDEIGVVIVDSVEAALSGGPEVLIDYTSPTAVKGHVMSALAGNASCVIGTSGLNADDYQEIDAKARQAGVGVVAAGNFSLTAALGKHFAGIAAKHIPSWEIIDYSHGSKPDAPSGTAQELAEYLGGLAENQLELPIADTLGSPETRGGTIGGAQVHSLRLPSYVLSFEAIFGMPSERLSIRHDAGAGAEPYVTGTLLAAQYAVETRGLTRGLDTLLFGD